MGLTTFRALVTGGRLTAGESLLVFGASDGVATTAVLLGLALGAIVVITSRSSAKVEAARGLGAVAGVDYGLATGSRPCAPYDPAGGASSWAPPSGARRVSMYGATTSGSWTCSAPRCSPRDLAGLLDLVAHRDVGPPVIDRSFALGDAAAAHAHLEWGGGFGNVVLLH